MKKLLTIEPNQNFYVFDLELQKNSSVISTNYINVMVTRDQVDKQARELSKLVPDGSVYVKTMSRVKATYVNGIRTRTNDMREFYCNLSDEEYENTKFLCVQTHQYV